MHIVLMYVHMASHLDGNDNHAVRLKHFLNNELIHAGYRVYWDVSIFAHQVTYRLYVPVLAIIHVMVVTGFFSAEQKTALCSY